MFDGKRGVQPGQAGPGKTIVGNRFRKLRIAVPALLLSSALAACGLGQPVEDPALDTTAVITELEPTTGPTDVEVIVPTDEVATGGATAGQAPMELALDDFIANPNQYLGQQVIVTGNLSEVLGPRSFILDTPEAGAVGANNTLVIGSEESTIPSSFAANTAITDQVQVSGTVREFDRIALEQELGYQFSDTWADIYTGEFAILADQVELVEGAGQAAQPTAAAGQGAQPTAAAGQGDADMAASIPEAARGTFPFVSVGQIDVDPQAYIGQRVTAWGEVDEQLGPNTFRVDEGNILDVAGELLVVVPQDAPRPDNLQNETSIAITGMVQQFVAADFERDYGVLFDDPGLEAEFESRPVMVADIVYTRASVSDIDDDAEAYIGNRVTVIGDVTELVDARTFRLDDPALLGGDDILVFMGDTAMAANIGEEVLVTGEVREFNRDVLANDYNYTWDDPAFDNFAEGTIIIAENLQAVGTADTAAGTATGTTGGYLGDDRYADTQIGISDIADDPTAYIGEQVTVNGEVSQALGQNTIRMDENNWTNIGDDILVVLPENVAQPETLVDGTNIVVEGTVRNFVLADFERDYDFFTDSELYAEFENRPVLVAETLWLQATLSDVDDNPEAYLGNRVTVFGEASELVGLNSFRLQDPGFFAGDDVLVLMRDEAMRATEGARYYVTGTVQRFNRADIETELGYALDEQLFTDWNDRTVIIADSVQGRAQP